MNTNLSYAPDATKVGFADISGGSLFVDTLQLTPDEQKDIFYTAANRCRGSFIPTWSGENQFFPSSIPPVNCNDNNGGDGTIIIEVTDLNANPLQPIGSPQVVGNNIQDLTVPPNKMQGINISNKEILTFVIIGAGIFLISKILS